MTKSQFLDKAHDVHGYKYTYIDLPDKVKQMDYINISYDDIIYSQRVSKHLMGKCPDKNVVKKTTESFILDSKKIWGDRFDYTDVVYSGALKKVKIYDKKNNIFVEQIASSHLSGHEVRSLDFDKFIEKSKITSDFMYNYDKCEYVNKTTKVIITCPDHGDFLVTPFNHINHGEVCKKCQFTEFSKRIKKYLNSKELSYNQEYKFNNFELRFDFYIPSIRTCIEFDNIKARINNCESLKINDKIKNDYCEDNYINLIRIGYKQINIIDKILYDNIIPLIKILNK